MVQASSPVQDAIDKPLTEQRFLKGVSISVWQNSPDPESSNWTHFMRRKNHFGQKERIDKFHETNDFWNRYETDLALASSLGATSFRFSFEWARLEPRPGFIDPSAVARYHAMLDAMARLGLEPCATLHHFTHPQWFEQAGGFVDPANNATFVNYCKTVFAEYGGRIRLWATFNEPTCYCFMGYFSGMWPPGKAGQLRLCGEVLGNILRAHMAAYRALKAMPGGQAAQVGLVHQAIRFVPKAGPLSSWYVQPMARWLTDWFGGPLMMKFFSSGKFSWPSMWGGAPYEFEELKAPQCFDWWGVNYYTRPAVNWRLQLAGLSEEEPLTDMRMPLVASDLGHHLRQAAALGRPLYVTETGIADKHDVHRSSMIHQYYGQILGAVADGVDVRGVFFWTLRDNIEWHEGYGEMHFGLYGPAPAPAAGTASSGSTAASTAAGTAGTAGSTSAAAGSGAADGSRGGDSGAAQLQAAQTGNSGTSNSDAQVEGSSGGGAAGLPVLREGSKALLALHQQWPCSLAELRQFAAQQRAVAQSGLLQGPGVAAGRCMEAVRAQERGASVGGQVARAARWFN